MTREEAIAELSVIWERLRHPEDCENGCYSFRDGDYLEALDMAIEALSAPIVAKHFDIQSGYIYCSPQIAENVKVVVRCKDCKWAEKAILDEYCVECTMYHTSCAKHGYCHHGERREK